MEITAKIICDSISEIGVRITTFELVYPRIIHAEVMTHRMFSRNAASSRAIPFNKMKEQLTGRPVRFGEANPGMQDKGVDFDAPVEYYVGQDLRGRCTVQEAWDEAKVGALHWAELLFKAGYHKQVYNRLTEPFQMIKVLVTATDFANFFWLRNDTAADPTLHELARLMKEEYDSSEPKLLQPGQWHLPYITILTNGDEIIYCDADFISDMQGWIPTQIFTLEDAIKVSAARCAAVSFRNTDYTLEKSLEVYERLVGDERKHASAFEHQATPMNPTKSDYDKSQFRNQPGYSGSWQEGITHTDRAGNLWSGNFREWIQYRQLIEGHNKESY